MAHRDRDGRFCASGPRCWPPALCCPAGWPTLAEPGLLSHRQPWFYGWGFNLPRGQALLEKWNLIPEGVDILVTHGPPLGKSRSQPCLPSPGRL